MKQSPLIGITSQAPKNNLIGYSAAQDYTAAISRAGGTAVIIPHYDPDFIDTLCERLDGFVFIGGADINLENGADLISSQNEVNHQHNINKLNNRDYFEIKLIQTAIKKNKAIFCICRGMQLLNVALGGTLIQDIPSQYPKSIAHQDNNHNPISHNVYIEDSTTLANLVGNFLEVRSWHHQALNKLANNLIAVAWATDGIIEAVELKDYPKLLAVQWHPELNANTNVQQQQLFNYFISLC